MIVINLLAELIRLGIRLAAHGDRLRFHPRWAVTPDLADRLKAHKADLLEVLRPMAGDALVADVSMDEVIRIATPTPAKPVCRCGSSESVDVPIHDGRSIRRDCGRCRRFIDFPVWYVRGVE